jgi:general secretion pathway protein G
MMRSLILTAILVGIGYVMLTVNIDVDSGAKTVAARAQIDSFVDALDSYKRDTEQYPSPGDGLNALRIRPSGAVNWQGPYLPRPIPRDPWGREYIYRFPGTHGTKPEIVSYGADGKPGGTGQNADIESWKLE